MLARYLGLELGGRWSKYDEAGELDAWKLGLDWEPIEGVRFRTMAQRSAREPNLQEAFQLPFDEENRAVFLDPREDPCSASADPVGSGLSDVCIAQGIPASELGVFEAQVGAPVTFTYGGNPNLQPEIAETLTAGIVLSMFDPWTLSVDYFEIEVEDTIGQVRTTGFDTQLHYMTALPDWLVPGSGSADLDFNVVWTHLNVNSVQSDPASTALQCAEKFGFTCFFLWPRHRNS